MARSQPARQLVDETWLRGSNGLLVVTRTRVSRDPGYTEAFRKTILGLFDELWPSDEPMDTETHLQAVDGDIKEMPLDLLDDLVDALGQLADACGSAQTPENGAARVMAAWLRTRAVELRGDGDIQKRAHQLGKIYPDLLHDVLQVDDASKADVTAPPPPPAGQEARLDQLL